MLRINFMLGGYECALIRNHAPSLLHLHGNQPSSRSQRVAGKDDGGSLSCRLGESSSPHRLLEGAQEFDLKTCNRQR